MVLIGLEIKSYMSETKTRPSESGLEISSTTTLLISTYFAVYAEVFKSGVRDDFPALVHKYILPHF